MLLIVTCKVLIERRGTSRRKAASIRSKWNDFRAADPHSSSLRPLLLVWGGSLFFFFHPSSVVVLVLSRVPCPVLGSLLFWRGRAVAVARACCWLAWVSTWYHPYGDWFGRILPRGSCPRDHQQSGLLNASCITPIDFPVPYPIDPPCRAPCRP